MDLISEAHYNVARDGKTYGPYKASKLCEMAASGRLQKSDHLWTDGMDDWHPAMEVPQLVSQFKPQTQPESVRSTSPAPTTSSEASRATSPAPASRSAESKPKEAAAPVTTPAAVKERSKSSTIVIEEPAPLPEKPTDFEKINFDQLPLARMKSK